MSQYDNTKARAEQLWRELGCPNGRDSEIWLMAEDAIKREGTAASKSVVKPAAKPAAAKPAAAKKTDAAKPAASKTTAKK